MEHESILKKLRASYSHLGLEVYPFKIGWYNPEVDPAFRFDLNDDTFAVLIASTPDMFEKLFLPFISVEHPDGFMDLLDRCMKTYFAKVHEMFPEDEVEIIHDFEMTPSRRPKILVQPASHVSGAAYYYTTKSLDPNPFDKKMYGVCIHPKFGGWFALRGVFIFKNILCPNLPRVEPVDCVPDQESKVKLLKLFNEQWKDWTYRDIIPVEKKYSEDQKEYFGTEPKDRKPLITKLRENYLREIQNNPNSSSLADGDTAENGDANKIACES
ncbi:cyanocobalamin reductase / alkylcobalamin dealkylase-like [Physella acuta]|uniref:cyanocobalamin reductase / alkylcobalamin dealkylase-like n=1 Tax=Physella acuta TaxID=109671 RepID=UPI0027DCAC5D|nr:cyanocobalamin reductase / alkylcobalamin dealkylase-like [Physella acuta]